jgi:predicted PurR-regulated permease PerM
MRSFEHHVTEVVPDWLVNIAALGWRLLVVVALGAVVLLVAVELATVTAAVIVSVIAAAAFSPGVRNLRERGWSRVRAAATVTTIVVIVAVGLIIVILLAFLPFVADVVTSLATATSQIQAGLTVAGLPTPIVQALEDLLVSAKSVVGDQVSSALASIANAFSVGILALFTTFFLLLDGEKAWAWLVGFVPENKRDALTEAGTEARDRVGEYFRNAAIVATIDAASDFVFLTILGVPLAAPLAILVFFFGFIPYVGTLIAASAIVLVTWASAGTTAALILSGLLVAVWLLERRFLGPTLSGRQASVHPAVVLVALPIGATLGGIAGMLIVIPIVAMLVAVNSAVLDLLDPGPAVSRQPFVPGWLDRLAGWSWRLLVVAAIVGIIAAVIAAIPLLFIPALFGIFFAATLAPAVERLHERDMGRTLSAGVTTIATFATIVFLIGLAVVSLGVAAGQIAGSATAGAAQVLDGTELSALVNVVETFADQVDVISTSVVATLAGLLAGLVFVALLCFLFLRDGGQIWTWLLGRLPAGSRAEIGVAGPEAAGILSGYMFGTAVISAFGATTQFLIMVILGIPLALPLAILTFFAGFIPYIGPLITTLLAFLVTIATGDTTDVVVMFIFTIVFNIVQGNFVAPLVYGRTVNLHPAIVLLAIPAGGAIAGVTGMIIVVPLLGIVATTWRHVLAAIEAQSEPETAIATPVPATNEKAAAAPRAEPGVALPET